MLGLQESGRHDLVADMVGDFAYLIDTYGHIPNGTRTYYLSRSQPPFFFEMVGLLSPAMSGEAFARYLPQLKREYAFWMQGAERLRRVRRIGAWSRMPDGSILNRYWDDRDTPRDESYREDTELARSQRPASPAGVPRHSRGRGKRLGLRLALVRRPAPAPRSTPRRSCRSI
jgi:alpha,alpha-trehalase